jgi:hypothetical protein
VDWAAVAAKLEAGSAPAPGALNSRTTWLSTVNVRYDRARTSLDRHATYIVAAFVAGAAR